MGPPFAEIPNIGSLARRLGGAAELGAAVHFFVVIRVPRFVRARADRMAAAAGDTVPGMCLRTPADLCDRAFGGSERIPQADFLLLPAVRWQPTSVATELSAA